MVHPVVWFEVMGKNADELQSFYTSLFGWKIDASSPQKYGLVEAATGRGIPGGVGQLDDKPWPSKVTFYVSTENIVDSLDKLIKQVEDQLQQQQQCRTLRGRWRSSFSRRRLSCSARTRMARRTRRAMWIVW